MKARNGFVSNSSSSSFLIGIGKVRNGCQELVEAALARLNLDYDAGLFVCSGDELRPLHRDGGCHMADMSGKNVVVTSFNDSTVCFRRDLLSDGDIVLVANISNNEGDEAFNCGTEEDYEANYDISYDFFPEEQQRLMDLFGEKKLIQHGDVSIGAGRNG